MRFSNLGNVTVVRYRKEASIRHYLNILHTNKDI